MARNKGFTPDEIQAKMKELQDAGVKNASASDALAVLTVEGRIASKTAKEADGDGKSGETARERTRRLAGAKATKSKSASSEKSKDDGKQPEEAKEAEEASSVEHTQGEFIAWIPRDPKDGGPFGFVKIANGDRKGQEAYANTRAFVSSEDANKMSQQGHGAMAIFDLKEHDDSRLAASNVVILNWGDAWPRHEKGDGNRMGSENNPIVVAINGPVKILSALSVLEQGGISITPDTYVTGTCLCGNPWLVQVKVVHGMGAAGLDQMRCGPCYKKVKGKPAIWRFRRDQNEDDGQRQQMRPPDRQKAASHTTTAPDPEKRKTAADEARQAAKTILAGAGDTPASRLQAMVVLVKSKTAADEAEAKAEVEVILAEIEAEKEVRRVKEIRRQAEEETAAARVQAIEEAATILRKSRSQTNMAKALAVLSQAGLELAVIAEVEARVAEMEAEERQQAEKEAAAARQARVTELAEAAMAAASAEGIENPENAIATAIAASEIEFDEKIEALTMANAMWAESQEQPEEPAEAEEVAEKTAETVLVSAKNKGADETDANWSSRELAKEFGQMAGEFRSRLFIAASETFKSAKNVGQAASWLQAVVQAYESPTDVLRILGLSEKDMNPGKWQKTIKAVGRLKKEGEKAGVEPVMPVGFEPLNVEADLAETATEEAEETAEAEA